MPRPPATRSLRLALRLRRGAVRWYEVALYLLLLAMTLAVLLPSAAQEADDDPVQCGNSQSSPMVMTR
jgi:hypothetical protein